MIKALMQHMMQATFRDCEAEIVVELLACTDPRERKLLELELMAVRNLISTGRK